MVISKTLSVSLGVLTSFMVQIFMMHALDCKLF